MKVKYRTNLWAGIVSMICGVILLAVIPGQIGTEYSSGYGITSRSIPYTAAAIFMAGGALLIIQSRVLKKDTIKELNLVKEGKGLAYMAIFAVYAVLFDYSFIISSIFLGAMTLVCSKSRKKMYYIIVSLTVLILYLLFTQVLHVRLK